MTSFRCDPALWDALGVEAERSGVSRSEIIRRAIVAFVNRPTATVADEFKPFLAASYGASGGVWPAHEGA